MTVCFFVFQPICPEKWNGMLIDLCQVYLILKTKKYLKMTFINVHPRKRRKSPFDQLINEFWNDLNTPHANNQFIKNRPAVNIAESKEQYALNLAIPGLTKEDLKIEVDKGILTISAKKENILAEGEQYRRREFDYSDFKRTFKLPKAVDAEKINANVANGILVLTLGKKEEAIDKGPRTIEVA